MGYVRGIVQQGLTVVDQKTGLTPQDSKVTEWIEKALQAPQISALDEKISTRVDHGRDLFVTKKDQAAQIKDRLKTGLQEGKVSAKDAVATKLGLVHGYAAAKRDAVKTLLQGTQDKVCVLYASATVPALTSACEQLIEQRLSTQFQEPALRLLKAADCACAKFALPLTVEDREALRQKCRAHVDRLQRPLALGKDKAEVCFIALRQEATTQVGAMQRGLVGFSGRFAETRAFLQVRFAGAVQTVELAPQQLRLFVERLAPRGVLEDAQAKCMGLAVEAQARVVAYKPKCWALVVQVCGEDKASRGYASAEPLLPARLKALLAL